jgi:hypothetical protein
MGATLPLAGGGKQRAPGFGNVGIAAAALTGHNAAWHDLASGWIGVAGPAGLSGKA